MEVAERYHSFCSIKDDGGMQIGSPSLGKRSVSFSCTRAGLSNHSRAQPLLPKLGFVPSKV